LDNHYTNNPFDFRINQVPFDELIRHYERVHFLYSAKKQCIQPFFPLITDNWKKALKAGDKLLWVASSHREKLKKMSTISLWRSTANGWVAQHLTSNAGPEYVRNILIGTQLHAIENKYRAGQNWFQPSNKYANSIFGSIEQSIGSQYASVNTYGYFFLTKNLIMPDHSDVTIVKYQHNYQKTLREFFDKTMGQVYMTTEEYDTDDIELSLINDCYKGYGLFRYRVIWLAFHPECADCPAGIIIAYRGPLGFNFSLMENRIELILNKNLEKTKGVYVSSQLFKQAITAYSNHYPVNYM